jgi:hypothetical protein
MTSQDPSTSIPSIERFGAELMRGIESGRVPRRRRRAIAALAVVVVGTPLAVAGAHQLAGDEPASDAPGIATDPATVDACLELLREGKHNYPCLRIVEEFAPEQLPTLREGKEGDVLRP